MDGEQAGSPGRSLFARLGYSPEKTPETVPKDVEIMRGMAAVNAHLEAQIAKRQPDLNTPEGRKKAAEAESAERKKKGNNWISRVIIDRGNGWKPIWGSAEDQELRIYTLVKGGIHRFWGVKPIGMGIDYFWETYDPEVKRYEDIQQETPVNPDAPTGPLIGEPPRSPSSTDKITAKPRKRQRAPKINPTNRVRKSSTESQKVNVNTRKSLADKVGAGESGLQGQVVEVPVAAYADGRPIRNQAAAIASDTERKSATADGGSAPTKRPRGRPASRPKPAAKDSKRPRGRPPGKGTQAEKLPKQRKTPNFKGDARVTKSQKEKSRPSAPSTHKMRTRGAGPAELLRLP